MLLVLDVLCSNETLVDFEPFTVENEIQALFPNLPSYHNNLYEGCNNAKIIFHKPDCIDISEEIIIQYKVKIKSINMIKKHLKPTKENKGGIISKENFIHLSNIKNIDNTKKKEKKIGAKK